MSTSIIPVSEKKANLTQCLNKSFIDSLIQRYTSNAQIAVEHTIQMCQTVAELHKAEKDSLINIHDIEYFCESVKLRRNSSQYRKFICIGQNADVFQNYIDRIPQAVSVLYEITTLDPDKFVELMDQNLIDQNTSLHKLKMLVGKAVAPSSTNASTQSFMIEFDTAKVSLSTAKVLLQISNSLKSNSEVKLIANCLSNLEKIVKEQENDQAIEVVAIEVEETANV
jgi:hypothetical protein